MRKVRKTNKISCLFNISECFSAIARMERYSQAKLERQGKGRNKGSQSLMAAIAESWGSLQPHFYQREVVSP